MGDTGIRSNLLSLQDISLGNTEHGYNDPLFFNIPIYQRPYVWDADIQVKTLMEDLLQAFPEQETYTDSKQDFHLGGVLVVRSKEGKRYDLIDGQQRFTTLWLLAQELKGTDMDKFRMDDNKSRIHFSIRDHFNAYFEGQKVESGELKHVKAARAKISQLLDDSKVAKEEFAKFVYEHVKLILTKVPQDTDLNKLFEVINNRGVQLQQHEILKASLLEKIDASERGKYAALWNACSDMNNYLEKSMRAAFSRQASDIGSLYTEKNKDLSNGSELWTALKVNSDVKSAEDKYKLCEILKTELSLDIDKKKDKREKDNDEDEHTKVSSIVSFPLFLLHVLRVYLKERGENIPVPADENLDVRKHVRVKNLIRMFKENLLRDEFQGEDAKQFIELLWKLRWQFDKHVVKWVEQGDSSEKELMIGTITKSNNYLSRTFNKETVDTRTMLQSMLYHSQELTTQHWLTPLLHQMSKTDKEDELFKYLQHVDNRVIWAKGEGDLAQRMWNAMSGFEDATCPDWKLLLQPLGTGFPHYWFYKLEFVLWYDWYQNKLEALLKDVNEAKLKSYRIRSRNSVEHVSAQTEDASNVKDNEVSLKWRHQFGNLALVSREFNSEASNHGFEQKKGGFKEKITLESLKLALIYANDGWGDDKAKEHHLKMMKVLCDYWESLEGSYAHLPR